MTKKERLQSMHRTREKKLSNLHARAGSLEEWSRSLDCCTEHEYSALGIRVKGRLYFLRSPSSYIVALRELRIYESIIRRIVRGLESAAHHPAFHPFSGQLCSAMESSGTTREEVSPHGG